MKTEERFNMFLSALKSQLIYCEKMKDTLFNPYTFIVTMCTDKYTEYAAPQLNNLFYEDADKLGLLFMNQKPNWNNTKHIGFFIVDNKNETGFYEAVKILANDKETK